MGSGAGATPPTNDIRATNGWIRLLPAGAPCAGYLTLENTTDHGVELTDVTTPDFERVQMHESFTTREGNARMRPIPRLLIAARTTLRFAPGGYHLMLVHPRRRLTPGTIVTAELHFAHGPPIDVPLVVRPADYEEPAPTGKGHNG